MPVEQSGTGMGRRRQGDTEPDRPDDRNRSLERALDDGGREGYDRGRQAGAHGTDTPHEPLKPGTRKALEEAGLGRRRNV
jgi:hypothetical protein